ncbi:MAG: SBBP repeat-containing protein [Nitrospirota bacterium]
MKIPEFFEKRSLLLEPSDKGNLLKIIFLFSLILLFATEAYSSTQENPSKITYDFSKLQIPFIENLGHANKEIKYYARMFGGNVVITGAGEIVYILPKVINEKISTGLILREKFVNGKIKDVSGEEVSSTNIRYFLGTKSSNWGKSILVYKSVSLGEVYKNLEIKIKAHGNNVEKLLFINSGGNPEEIKISLEGAESLTINKSGQLEVETDLGTVKFSKPVAYQEINGERVEVSVSYILESDGPEKIYGFQIGEYDKTRTLVIDPLLASALIGGSRDDFAYALTLDSSGNVYVSGYTMAIDFPISPGIITASYLNGSDVFVSKLNSDLTSLLTSAVIGGVSDDLAYSVKLDSSGNVYLSGYTMSADFPTTPGVFTASIRGGSDVFISKLDSDLTSLLGSTVIGGNKDDFAYSLALDFSGNIYVGGYTASTDFPVTLDALSTSFISGTADAFISKFNNDLTSLLASTFVGGSDTDYIRSLAVFSDYDLYPDIYIYAAGNTFSSDFPITPDAYDSSFNGKADTFIVLLNTNLTFLVSSTFLGGSRDDYASAVVLDSAGNVYVTGDTSSPDFPTTPGTLKSSLLDQYSDVFISKFDSGLMFLLASTFLGGSHSEYSGGIALGKEQAYGGTATLLWEAPTTNADGTPLTDLSGYNVYYGTSSLVYNQVVNVGNATTHTVNNLESGLTYYFAVTAYDSSGNESQYSNEVSKTINPQDLSPSFYSDNVFVTGSTFSSDFPVKPYSFIPYFMGDFTDAFIARLDNDLTELTASTYLGGRKYDHGSSIAVGTSGDVYIAGITYSPDFPFTFLNDATMNSYANCFLARLDSNLSSDSPITSSSYGTDYAATAMVAGQTIRVLSPNGSEILTSGSNQNIQWQTNVSDNPVTEMKLFYTKNGGKTWKLIKKLKSNSGTYVWKVPKTNKILDKCLIKVVLKDSSGRSETDISDSNFTIQP